MRNTYLFSLRRVLLNHVSLPGILLVLLIGFWGFTWLKAAFNPADLNHLLIVDLSNQSFEPPCMLILNGKVIWEKRLDQLVGRGAPSNGRVHIINWDMWLLINPRSSRLHRPRVGVAAMNSSKSPSHRHGVSGGWVLSCSCAVADQSCFHRRRVGWRDQCRA